MSNEIERLQAEVRAVFGPLAGELEEGCRRDPDSPPRSGAEPDAPPPYLDHCTHNTIAARSPDLELPRPDSEGSNAPEGLAHTELMVKTFRDGSVEACIIDRNSNYRKGRRRERRETFAQNLKRHEVMDAEDMRRSGRRAKTNVRRACAQIIADRLATLTFRDHMDDAALGWRIFGQFRGLYVSELPYTFKIGHQSYTVESFDYVCVPEWQKRDVLHFHLGLNKPHDVNRLRRCWQKAQRICGLQFADGNVNIKRKFSGTRSKGSQGCARYLGKYINKAIDGGYLFKRRYSTSKGIPDPGKHAFYFFAVHNTVELWAFVADRFGVKLERDGFGKAGPYQAAFASFVPP